MTRLTLLLLVDAFRPDYLRDAPYLGSLAARSAMGRLREPFGFLPRAAYFGGLSAGQCGYTNMLHCDPARLPFAVARWLPPAAFTTTSTAAAVRRFVDDQARAVVPDFAASYVSSLNIPGELLPHFAVSEIEAPWSPRAGYRSIFHELDERGEAWIADTWPLTNRLADRSDRGIVDHLRATLGPQHRFAYGHLQELDAAGHHHGPEGAVLRHLVRRTDTLVQELVESLRLLYDELHVIVFGDHGMVSVTRTVDVRPTLASTGLVPGIDYVYFLDSTMVRLWFLTARARAPLIAALSQVAGLKMLEREDKVRHQIDACPPANAHEIFLADPGVVISPDFFGGEGPAPLGMHGYDPDCRDNQGLFLAHGPGIPVGEAGVVDAAEIYDWTRELLGLAVPREGRVIAGHAPARPRFTQSTAPSADACVASQLDRVVESLQPLAGRAEAIVLTGSFGRGEGGAVATGAAITALNDFDVLVVGGPDISEELAGVGPGLASSVGLDFLDLAWADGRWQDMPATMLNLDLRYGSQVLRGAPDVLSRMPPIPAGDITMQDALTLLVNRIGGLLSGLTGEMFAGLAAVARSAMFAGLSAGARSAKADRYLVNQVVKALVAVGDTYLVEWRAYDASYRARRERFSCLAPGAGVADAVREAVDCAYQLKVRPDYSELPDPSGAAVAAAPLVLERLRHVAGRTYGRTFSSLPQVTTALAAVTGEWVAVDNARLLERDVIIRLVGSGSAPRQSIRQAVYAALPLLLLATVADGFRPSQQADGALACFAGIERGSDWDSVRSAVVSAWLSMNH